MGCGVSRGYNPDVAVADGAAPGPVVEHSLGSRRSFRGKPAPAVKASPASVSFYVSDALRIFSRTLQGAMGGNKGKVSPQAGAASPEHRAAPGSPGGAAAAAGLEAVRRLAPGEAAIVALTHAQSYGLLHASSGGTADCKGGRDSASLWELRRERDDCDDGSSGDMFVTALNLGTGSFLAHDGGRPCMVHPAALKPGGGGVEAAEGERRRRCVFRCILHPKEGSLSLVAAGAPGAESVGQVIGRGGRPLPARYCLGASNSGALKELRTVGAAGDGGRFYATTPGSAHGGAFALTVADRGESVGRAAVKDIAWRPEHHAARASPPRR